VAAVAAFAAMAAVAALAFTVVEAAGWIENGRHQLHARREIGLKQENGRISTRAVDDTPKN
jgi:hypothetical protein